MLIKNKTLIEIRLLVSIIHPNMKSIQKHQLSRLILFFFMLINFTIAKAQTALQSESVIKIEMNLSAFGVESNGYPTIHAFLNLQNDSSYCKVTYYDPKFRDTSYSFSKPFMDSIRRVVNNCNIKKLDKFYSINWTDQPTSTIIFYFKNEQIKISDYGLKGNATLITLYNLVYNLEMNFR